MFKPTKPVNQSQLILTFTARTTLARIKTPATAKTRRSMFIEVTVDD
jgi:hypothetical protein